MTYPANAFLKDPLTGMWIKVVRTGRLALQAGYNGVHAAPPFVLGERDVPPDCLVSFRDMAGGRGSGFPEVQRLTMADCAQDPIWRGQLQGLVNWCARMLAYCAALGVTPE